MSQAQSQAAFEADLGRWPRRLLHVPTMTSHTWQPGNVYGTATAPAYNALTYTWGRWRIRNEADHPKVRPVDIRGVPWDIPRVDPAHFSRDDFHAVIQRAVGAVPAYAAHARRGLSGNGDGAGGSNDAVEFLWLDIACIDQRRGSPDAAAEVGRQAAIFRGAQYVFVWLTTFSGPELVGVLSNLSIPRGLDPKARLPRPLRIIQDSLDKLCADPWFSSLWTLQEAFLRQDALFLSRDGAVAGDARPPVEEGLYFVFCIGVLMYMCKDLVRFINDEIWDPKTPTTGEASVRHQALIDRIGFAHSWASHNPLSAYVASAERKTSRETDRVYGIQQIFEFRLGATAADAPHDRVWTREELEVQLSREIVARFPLMSQLFLATKPVKFGDGWRISPGSFVENDVLDSGWSRADLIAYGNGVWKDTADLQKHRQDMLKALDKQNRDARPNHICRLSTKTVDNHTWGHFQGRMIPFSRLRDRIEALTLELQPATVWEQNPDDEELDQNPEEIEDPNLLTLSLDISELIPTWPAGWKWQDDALVGAEREACKWLNDKFPKEDLMVLGLATLPEQAYGLVLLRTPNSSAKVVNGQEKRSCWRRLGFCNWWMTNTLDMALWPGSSYVPGALEGWEAKYGPYLRAESEDWVEMEGLFG